MIETDPDYKRAVKDAAAVARTDVILKQSKVRFYELHIKSPKAVSGRIYEMLGEIPYSAELKSVVTEGGHIVLRFSYEEAGK
jgi:hypothetical protein